MKNEKRKIHELETQQRAEHIQQNGIKASDDKYWMIENSIAVLYSIKQMPSFTKEHNGEWRVLTAYQELTITREALHTLLENFNG